MRAASISIQVLLACFVTTGSTAALAARTSAVKPSSPIATTRNGSYYGVHLENYNQDIFLGVPFAEPPVEQLRFANPVSLNTTWSVALPATDYSAACAQYGSGGFQQSEDCLYLNVVRPSGYDGVSLPVAVWIHGGGFVDGSPVSQQYNLSFIVENSIKIGKPIIATSIAYRLGPLGFLNGDDVAIAGVTNLGLKDQRLALHWINENIAGFGGDPSKVTIWGESAGATSVGLHLLAFNGRDDKLFRAGIMESGNPVFWTALNSTDDYQEAYDALLVAAGCTNSSEHLNCLRKVPFSVLNSILNTTKFDSNPVWYPAIDGDFVSGYGSEQLGSGSFVHVPIISGSNSDEGESFGPTGIYNTSDFVDAINDAVFAQTTKVLPESIIEELLQAYPDDPATGIPSLATLGGNVTLGTPYGAQYRRSAAYFGDENVVAARRLTCETFASAGVPAYCYRFNAIQNGNSWPIAVTHFSEVALVFNNIEGLGYSVNPFANNTAGYEPLSDLMSKSWASFVYDLEPNHWARDASMELWPVYNVSDPMDFVFDANVTSYAESDVWRAEGIKIINENWSLYRR